MIITSITSTKLSEVKILLFILFLKWSFFYLPYGTLYAFWYCWKKIYS